MNYSCQNKWKVNKGFSTAIDKVLDMRGRKQGTTTAFMFRKLHELRRILAEENGKPLTDEQIADLLTLRGYPTGNRRVHAIRKKLDIPGSYTRGKP